MARTLHYANSMPEPLLDLDNAVTRNPIVAPAEPRARAKVAHVVAERGHAPLPPPAVAEALNVELDEVRGLLDELVAGRHDVLIFMTGSSVSSLFELAQGLGRQRDLIGALRAMTTACRSPKAAAVLRGFALRPTLGEPELFTTRRLVYALSHLELAGRSVVRIHGAPGDAIANKLRAQGARLREFSICRRRPFD